MRVRVRSLTTKLLLAFVLTSVASVVLASILIRQFVTREFDDYVVQSQRKEFIANVGAYYETNGSWEGLDRWLRRREDSQPPDKVPGGPVALPVRFGLIDASGVVVLPYNGHPPGTHAKPAEVTAGTPVISNGQTVGTVITSGTPAFRNVAEQLYLSRTDMALAIVVVVMIGVAVVLGVLLARVITRPVRELTTAARRIAAGDLEQRVPVRSQDEIGVLANQFNQMSADLARATRLRRQMTADIAHDLRTPLTVIGGYMEALRDGVLKPTPTRFATMYGEVQFLQHLVEDLHTLSLADAGELRLDRQPVAPRQLLERVANSYAHMAEQQRVTLQVSADGPLPEIDVDFEQMIRALSNLVSNALRYTPAGGQVALSARAVTDGVQLAVADTGAGIAAEHLASIFERFYRIDAARQEETGGSGLGLAIARSIVEAHGGCVSVESIVGQGTTFTIVLPGHGVPSVGGRVTVGAAGGHTSGVSETPEV